MLSCPQAAARRQVADPPRGALAAGRLWQYLNTYRTHCSPDPLPTHLVTPYVFQKKF